MRTAGLPGIRARGRSPAATSGAAEGEPVTRRRRHLDAVVVIALMGGALLALHGAVLRYPFIADDYMFCMETRTASWGKLLTGFAVAQNYYRPLGREIYFFALTRVFGYDPLLFHWFNFGLLVLAVALVAALGWRLAGPRVGLLAAGAYALLYPHRVQLAWVSCSQDLLATAFGVGSALFYLRGRRIWAAALLLLGLFSKESVALLPLVLLLGELWRPGARWQAALERTLPLWGAMALWALVVVALRIAKQAWVPMEGALPVADIALTPGSLWQGFRLALLSYVYLDQPLAGLSEALAKPGWPWLAAGLAALAAFLATRIDAPRPGKGARSAPSTWRLGLLWATIGALPVAAAGHHFSAYYVSFAGVGFALLAGGALARLPWPAIVAVFVIATAADSVANRVDLFRVTREQPEPPGVSYISIARLDWERRYLDALRGALRQNPPPPGGVIYLSHTPRYLTLATAGDRAPKVWFDDPSLELSYITQYRPGAGSRARFVRFDPRRWTFAALPSPLVDAIVEGEDAMARGQFFVARAALGRALRLAQPGVHDIERVDLENSYGLACYRLGDPEEAQRAWLAALAIDPQNRGALLNLAAAEASRGRFAEARGLTQRVLAVAPDDPLALLYLARLERALGDPDGVRRAWEALAATNPAFADSVARASGLP